ncbi:MAG: hypothetical protein M0Z82_13620 [Actinomycetota bacterium]|nr:hypothetical protein [Actinomycetota bacterium]
MPDVREPCPRYRSGPAVTGDPGSDLTSPVSAGLGCSLTAPARRALQLAFATAWRPYAFATGSGSHGFATGLDTHVLVAGLEAHVLTAAGSRYGSGWTVSAGSSGALDMA